MQKEISFKASVQNKRETFVITYSSVHISNKSVIECGRRIRYQGVIHEAFTELIVLSQKKKKAFASTSLDLAKAFSIKRIP